jgi:transposase
MAKEVSVYERLTGGNRKQRKDLQRRLCSDDPELSVVHANAAGIDIGNESHFVAVPAGRDAEPVREFGSWTADLERMAAWLQSCGIETVAMQSTGVYRFAVYDVLEKHGLQVFPVNASHTKNLPGRKSDVQESQWLMKLHTYGLLRNSFRPPEEIRPIRAVWRLRDRHVEEAARSIQHMQQSLTSMNVPLANAISDVGGVSGQAILRSILAGERDARQLARLRDRRIKASEQEVARSLEGTWQEDQLFELQQAVEEYDFRQRQIAECDRKLQAYLAALPSRPVPDGDAGTVMPPPAAPGKKKRRAKKIGGGNAPQWFDLAAELKRVTGVDAVRIEGVNLMTIQTVVAELGTELGQWWPSERHFASWLGLSPQRDVSGGKAIRHTHGKNPNRVAGILRMAASEQRRPAAARLSVSIGSCRDLTRLGSTAGCAKPHVRWCGRVPGRNPRHSTRYEIPTPHRIPPALRRNSVGIHFCVLYPIRYRPQPAVGSGQAAPRAGRLSGPEAAIADGRAFR